MAVDIPGELLQSIRSARACMEDIRALAGKLEDLSRIQIEAALQGFLNAGEEQALSRLLQVSAFNQVKLDPKVLCSCIGVCEQLFDPAPCFALQDEHVIEPLLQAATAEALSFERQAFAAGLAAELTLRLGQDPQPVRKVLRKLEYSSRAPAAQLLIARSLGLLEQGEKAEQAPELLWCELKLRDLLPEHQPHNIVGGTYTVRRPVPKRGRNDPCHCGSGKKYKKCCYAKDQELLRDASAYAGTTRTELKTRPGLVDDPDVVRTMRAHELKKLTPAALGEHQLYSGSQRALAFGLRELAFEMLLELERRSNDTPLVQGDFEDLLEDVLQVGDLDLASKIRDHCEDRGWWRPQAIAFRFDLLEHPERLAALEQDCRKAVCNIEDKETALDDPLLRLAYDLAPRHPALGIAFARAAIASHPDRIFDNEMLLDVIRDARVDLDLEPESDPAEALFDWIEDRAKSRKKARVQSKEIEQLTDKLDAARSALEEKKSALRKIEDAIGSASVRLEQARATRPSTPESAEQEATSDIREEATLQRLRDQVASLKAGIGEQQAERRQLRKALSDERKKLAVLSESSAPASPPAAEEAAVVAPSGRPILPEYTDAFCKRLTSLAPSLAAKAILAAGRFAAHEAAVWRHIKPLERLPEHYRVRLGLDYRMIVHWQPGKTLRILDLIPRQDLESWIRRQG